MPKIFRPWSRGATTLQVTRAEYDHILLKAAAEHGAHVREECEISDVQLSENGVPSVVTWKAIARRYRTRYVNEVLRVYWQDQAVSLSHPAVAWTDAPGRLLDAESTIDHDVRWILQAPVPVFRDAVAYVTSSLHTGRGLADQWRRLNGIGPRALWAAAVPAGVAFYGLQRHLSPIARRLPSP